MTPQHFATVTRHTLITIAISAAGGGLAALAGLPAAWLMGGAVAVAVAFGAERAAFLDFFPMGAEPTGR